MLSMRFLTDRPLNAPEEFRGSWKCIWSSLSLERQLAVSARLLCARTLLDYLANECTRESLLPVLIRWASRHLVALRFPTSARHMWREMLYSRNITFVFQSKQSRGDRRRDTVWKSLADLKRLSWEWWTSSSYHYTKSLLHITWHTCKRNVGPRHRTITRKFEKDRNVMRDENVLRNRIIITTDRRIDKKILNLKNITYLLSNVIIRIIKCVLKLKKNEGITSNLTNCKKS